MLRKLIKPCLLAAVVIQGIACSPPPTMSGASSSQSNTAPNQGDLKFQAPAAWVLEQSTSSMRVAQYKLPRAEGDSDDAQLVLYYFGKGQGGSAEANLERWMGQMQQPDGKPSKEKAQTESLTVNGLKVSLLDLTGTYTAEMAPGSE